MIVIYGILCALAVSPQSRPEGEPRNPLEQGELPQYIFFNRAPQRGLNQAAPESFTADALREIPRMVGTSGNDRLRIGAGFVFSIMEHDAKTLAASLKNFLDASRAADVPVVVCLDGQNWWQHRPDLWNWWDPALPGYDPANALNVEWTGWGPEHAVKIGWRNWGRQHRVAPAPNLASPRFMAEHWKKYTVLVPLLVRWYNELPADRRYLFGGLKVGWEASINVNAYYYADGNRLLAELPPDGSKDPDRSEMEKGWTFGRQALGYAAVSTSKIRTKGELTGRDLEAVVHAYLEQLSRRAVELGVPRHLVFTHQGGNFPPWERHLSFKPAMNPYSIPGWSFYSADPADAGSLRADMEAADRTQWAAAEWWRGAADEAGWTRSFAASLNFKSCRFVCVYNWESIRDIPSGLAAVRQLVAQAATRPG